MEHPTDEGIAPDGVFEVVRLAVQKDLLSSIESLAAGLTGSGWIRETPPGLWRHRTIPGWSVVSMDHAPNASIFFTGSDEAVSDTEMRIRGEFDGGAVGDLRRRIEDPHWTIWSGGEVVISLNAEPTRRHEQYVVPATMQLAVERSDTPAEGLAPDPERARRIARTGSPLQRWHLAAERDLPEDVIELLRQDRDPAVAAAIEVARPSP